MRLGAFEIVAGATFAFLLVIGVMILDALNRDFCFQNPDYSTCQETIMETNAVKGN